LVRFAYQQTLEPATVHHYLVLAGVVPHLYTYRPRTDRWTFHVGEEYTEAVRQVLDKLGIEFRETASSSIFAN
jgi:transposase